LLTHDEVGADVRCDVIADPHSRDALAADGRSYDLELRLCEANRGGNHDQPGIHKDVCDLGEPTHVLAAVGVGMIQIGINPVQHVANRQKVYEPPVIEELRLELAAEPFPVDVPLAGYQQQRWPLAEALRTALLRYATWRPFEIALQDSVAHPGLTVGQCLANDSAAA